MDEKRLSKGSIADPLSFCSIFAYIGGHHLLVSLVRAIQKHIRILRVFLRKP